MQLETVAATHIGLKKDQNEDSFCALPEAGLFIVADGMGGHAAGEVASRMAVEQVSSALTALAPQLQALAATDTPESRKAIFDHLEDAVRRADRAISLRGVAEPDKEGMGTTLDVLLLAGASAYIGHVGDSRVYLLRGDKVFQLTTDHTVANFLLAQGRLSREEIDGMVHKNALVQALGMPEGATMDRIHVDFLADDRFVLCSDGLAGYVATPEELLQLARSSADAGSAEDFIRFANQRGGKDNITAVLVHVVGGAAVSARLETTKKLQILHTMTLFRGLAQQEILKVLHATQEVSLPAGEVVITQGDTAQELYFVLEGSVEVESDGVMITTLGAGAQFGELALVDDRPRSATVRTTEPTRLMVLRRAEFRELTRSGDLAPKLLWNLIFDVTERLRTTSWQLTEQVRAVHFINENKD